MMNTRLFYRMLFALGLSVGLSAAGVSNQVQAAEAAQKQNPTAGATPTADKIRTCPEWAMEQVPTAMQPYQGRFGLLYNPFPGPIAPNVAGIDFWQANHFIICRKETRQYLYSEYTPTQVHYQKGTLPAFEAIAARCTNGLRNDRDKALALLKQGMPQAVLHPALPPLSPRCDQNRGISDDALLKSKKAWCNEQSRVFVRLCQVSGIPARMIFLFYGERPYSDRRSGHVVAEFYADGQWSMADSSWLCVFPAADGHLMSAAECHELGPNRDVVGKIYHARIQSLMRLSDEEMAGKRYPNLKDKKAFREAVTAAATDQRKDFGSLTADFLGGHMDEFGVLNYPLPPSKRAANFD